LPGRGSPTARDGVHLLSLFLCLPCGGNRAKCSFLHTVRISFSALLDPLDTSVAIFFFRIPRRLVPVASVALVLEVQFPRWITGFTPLILRTSFFCAALFQRRPCSSSRPLVRTFLAPFVFGDSRNPTFLYNPVGPLNFFEGFSSLASPLLW